MRWLCKRLWLVSYFTMVLEWLLMSQNVSINKYLIFQVLHIPKVDNCFFSFFGKVIILLPVKLWRNLDPILKNLTIFHSFIKWYNVSVFYYIRYLKLFDCFQRSWVWFSWVVSWMLTVEYPYTRTRWPSSASRFIGSFQQYSNLDRFMISMTFFICLLSEVIVFYFMIKYHN